MKLGVPMPMGEMETGAGVVGWPTIRQFALQAEAGGLDAVWIYDHLIYRFEPEQPQGTHEAMMVLAALAEATERIELGSLVFCTAFRNPAVLAKMAVDLDLISEGRVILGLGAGWHQPEFDAFGLDFSHKVDQFEEAMHIIRPLVTTGYVDFQGHYSSANDCFLIPPPAREIPILIASFKPRMLQLTARYADQWNSAWHGELESFLPRKGQMVEACLTEGRDPSTLTMTAGVFVSFDESKEDFDRNKLLCGSPVQIAEKLKRYQDEGVGHVIVRLDPDFNTESMDQLLEVRALLN